MMTDKEIFELLHVDLYAGWGEMHRKYFSKKYFPSVILRHSKWVNRFYFEHGVHEEIWADAIKNIAFKVKKGEFVLQVDIDALLPGIAGQIKYCWLEYIRKNPIPAPYDESQGDKVPDIIPEETTKFRDMLLARIAIEQLEDPADRIIILLKYFPEKPEDAKLTDEEIALRLINLGLDKGDKNAVGVVRRRAIVKFQEEYKKMNKNEIEQALKSQEMTDFALMNIGFPVGEFYDIIFNTSKKNPEKERIPTMMEYLYQEQKKTALEQRERLRLYSDDLTLWMQRLEHLLPVPVGWNLQVIIQRLETHFNAFRYRFFN
jgi:hypothetical protein